MTESDTTETETFIVRGPDMAELGRTGDFAAAFRFRAGWNCRNSFDTGGVCQVYAVAAGVESMVDRVGMLADAAGVSRRELAGGD